MARRLFRLFLLTSCVYFALCVLLLLKHSRQQWVPLRGQLVSSPREGYFYVIAGEDEPAVAPIRKVKPQPPWNSVGNFHSKKLAVASSQQNGVLQPPQNINGNSRTLVPKPIKVAATTRSVKDRNNHSSNNSIQRLMSEKQTSNNKKGSLNVVKNNLHYKEFITNSTNANKRNPITKSVTKTTTSVQNKTKHASKNVPGIVKAVPHKANDVPVIAKTVPDKAKAVPVIAKAVPDKAKAVPVIAKAVLDIDKAVPVIAKAFPDKANALPYKAKAVPVIAKAVPHKANAVPVIAKAVLDIDKAVPVIAKAFPDKANALPYKAKAVPVIAKAVPHKANAVPVIAKAVPDIDKAVPVLAKAFPDKANALPYKAKAAPVIAKAVPDTANAVPNKANYVPDKANAVPDKTKAVPAIAKALPDTPNAKPDKANAVPDKTKAVPAIAKALQNKANAVPHKANALPHKANAVPHKGKVFPKTQPQKVPIAVRQVYINNHFNGSSLNHSKDGNNRKEKAKVLPISLASKAKANQREVQIKLNNKTITVTNSTEKPATNSSKKFLVFYCPQNAKCSGWGDQQRGIVDVFLLACIAKRHFRIILQSPCDVRNFYVPNKYNWIADEREFQGRTQRIIPKSVLTGKLKTMADFNAVLPEDVIYVSTNGGHFTEIMANPNFKSYMPTWAETFLAHHFHNAWDILMKPSARLQQRLEAFLHSVGFYNRTHPLVGVHVRVGKNPSNPNEVLHINDVDKTGPLWEFLDHYVRNGSHIFLASDSAEVRNISRSRFGTAHHDTDGVILHVAKQRHDPRACQGYEDALLDQLILTKCDVLVKSKSGFSLRAGYIRGRADDLFFYHQGNITKVKS
ncbi:uncharacterized protein [Littorina saxatilis]